MSASASSGANGEGDQATVTASPIQDEFSDLELDSDASSLRTQGSISEDIVCPSCGSANDSLTPFCVECRRPLTSPFAYEDGQYTAAGETEGRGSANADTLPSPSTTPFKLGGFTLPSFLSSSRMLMVTVLASVILNVILFLVWIFTTDHGLPWFIYPLAGTVFICGCLYLATHSVEDPVLELHALLAATINFPLIFTYVFEFTKQPYFAYVLIPSAALLCFHLLIKDYMGPSSRPHKFFYIHLLCIFIPLNLILFTVFLTTNPGEAWFVFPLLMTAIPMIAHYVIAFHPNDPHKWFYVDVATASCLAGFLLLLWAVTPTAHPWFVYPWIAMGVFIFGHYLYDYRPVSLQQGAGVGLTVLQKVGTILGKLRPTKLTAILKRRMASDKPPAPTTTGEDNLEAEVSATTPASQV